MGIVVAVVVLLLFDVVVRLLLGLVVRMVRDGILLSPSGFGIE